MRRNRFTIALCLSLLAACAVEETPPSFSASTVSTSAPTHIWPPRVGEPYPDLKLRTPQGDRVALSTYKGKVLLIEPIGMDCPACNAFAGANRPGSKGFQGAQSQKGLPSASELLRDYSGGISLDDPRLVFVHLLLYKPGRQGPPSLETARLWEKHFAEARKAIVLVGEDYLIGPASYAMVPGFQLVDSDFVLRFDGAGHHPRHDIYRELFPAMPSLIGRVGSNRGGRGQARVLIQRRSPVQHAGNDS